MRKDLHMSPGKLAAQVSHCAEAYWTKMIKETAIPVKFDAVDYEGERYFNIIHDEENCTHYQSLVLIPKEIFEQYVNGIFTKTICEAKNKKQLLKAKEKAEELKLIEGEDFGLIYDKCLTELEPEETDGSILTGIWFKPLPDDIAHEISKKYQLYRGD